MTEMICPGLPADWVNAWLAAVGATRLEPRLQLRWTLDSVPLAVLCADDADPVHLLAEAWPTSRTLQELPIAETWGDTSPVRRKVSVEDFAIRARAARSDSFSWTLSSTLTDLDVSASAEVAHAPFDPAGPGTIKWLHHRLVKVHGHVDPTVTLMADSLRGASSRVKDNGLGFDITRLASQADRTAKWVDPVIEVLAFFGLALLPVRGAGTDGSINKSVRSSSRQRGWKRLSEGRSIRCFVWPAWSEPLDFDGIDALMDIWKWRDRSRWDRVGVHGGWHSVRYEKRGSGDTTRGYASERL